MWFGAKNKSDRPQLTLSLSGELTRQSLLFDRRGKSGLLEARCQVIPGGREPTESAAESRPPTQSVRVKGCGKSAPRQW